MKNYEVLAYYIFTAIADPHGEVAEHKRFFGGRDATSRIYISETGINGQMSAEESDSLAYREWMASKGYDIHFKIHRHHENVFPRLTIKYRKQLVAFDSDVDVSKGGEHVSPAKWSEMLEADDGHIVLDVRNAYEWKIGHFEGSECPPCETTRDFHQFTDDLLKRIDSEETPVMMFCTGGIRCEIYSALLKERGVKKIFQLQGGVINYGLEQGNKHWKGKLFVFDDRLAIPIAGEKAEVISACRTCGTKSDDYYNCANMDCNELFIACRECLKELSGCCQKSCVDAPHVRPYHHQTPHKPFRRKHHYRA